MTGAPAPGAPATAWHVDRGGEPHGPLAPEAVRALVARAQVTRDTLVWRPGLDDWQAAGTQPGLYPPAERSAASEAPARPVSYRPDGFRRVATVAGLGLGACAWTAALLAAANELRLVLERDAGVPVHPATLAEAADLAMVPWFLALLLHLATAVPFLAWMARVRQNVELLGARGLDHSRGWAIGGWFVPFLNLIRPYQVVNEIWGSTRDLVPAELAAHLPSPRVGTWWILYLGLQGTARAAMRLRPDAPGRLETIHSLLLVGAAAVALLAALAALRLVVRLSAAQRVVADVRGVLARPLQAGRS